MNININGLVVGILTFFIIGVFHPIVIKAEYHWGVKCWWIFLLSGLIAMVGSVLVSDIRLSIVLGVLSFTLFWSIKELFEQRERVRKGWFPQKNRCDQAK